MSVFLLYCICHVEENKHRALARHNPTNPLLDVLIQAAVWLQGLILSFCPLEGQSRAAGLNISRLQQRLKLPCLLRPSCRPACVKGGGLAPPLLTKVMFQHRVWSGPWGAAPIIPEVYSCLHVDYTCQFHLFNTSFRYALVCSVCAVTKCHRMSGS